MEVEGGKANLSNSELIAEYLAKLRAELVQRAQTDCAAWDELAQSMSVDLDAPRWNLLGANAVGWARPMGPARKARARCESGGRDYCSCEVCF